MNLSEFVKEVLTEIVAGVVAAQQGKDGAFVVPGFDGGHQYARNDRFSSNASLKSTVVDFDIALTVEESKSAGGGAEIKVWGVGAKAKGDLSAKDTSVSRVQFAIPILLPESQRSWFEEIQKRNEEKAK
ncbi:hypothetical protein P3T40_003559 [Paraburkholderia sp. EB58]|uniref:trypco2 family protein n=1 Tax=Paraburkholderia sp. EB58 TaxID=3035125 RepID=UPI003D25073C